MTRDNKTINQNTKKITIDQLINKRGFLSFFPFEKETPFSTMDIDIYGYIRAYICEIILWEIISNYLSYFYI